MKQKSRLSSRFLALLLIFTMLCTAVLPVSAASAPALSAANATAKVGDTFTVAVSLKNAASVYNGNFTLQYDSSVLEVQSYTYGNIFNGHTKNCNLDYQSTGNQIRLTFSGAYALTGDGTLVTFTFKAKTAGSSDLQFTAYKMYDENGVSLSPTATNGTATVSAVAVASPVLSVANATANVGDAFTVAVSLKNAASVYNGNFTLQYDSSVLEVQSYTYGNIFNGHTKNCNLDYQSTGNQIRLTFSGAYALTGDGTLVTFTFKAKAAGSSDLQFTAYKMYDENGVSLSPTATNGTVAVDEIPSKTLSSISVQTKPTKTQYYIGDSLNTSGLQLKLTYSDGSTEIISSGFTTSGFTSASAGTKTVTVSYGGKSTTFTVTVNTPTVSLSSTGKSMTVGDTATLTATTTPGGQTVTWTSSNTSVATVSGGTVTAKAAGTATITAKFVYNGQTYSKNCEVTVQESVPDGALRLDLPISGIIGQQVQIPIVLEDVALGGLDFTLQYDQTKLEYVSCTQNAFPYYAVNGDVPGQIIYSGSTSRSVPPGQVMLLTFNVIANEKCSTAVSLNVTDACADDVDSTDLNVIGGTWNLPLKKVLTAISIYTAPTKTQYYIGDSVNTSGLQLKLTYSDGSTEIISSGFTTSGFTSASAGAKTVIVSYGGKSTTFTVTVNTPTVSLSSTGKSMTVGDTATLTATTTPGGQTVTWTSSNTSVATVSGGTVTAKAAGTATITAKFTYNGIAYSKTCTITVVPAPVTLSSISVYRLPTKTQYYIGDSLNTSGLQLKLTYSDGSTEIISSGFTTSGFTSASAGTKTVTVSYGGKSTTFTVTVSVPVDAGTLYAQPSTACVGQQVNIPIYVDNATLGTLTFTVQFDSTKLKYISYSEESFEMVSVGTQGNSQITVACINNSKITGNGIVIVLTFEVLATENCNTDLTVSVIEATAPDVNDTPVALTGGTWSLQIIKGIPGDVNGDGKITAVDARWVLQAASGARTFDATQTAAADVNADGKINAVDARWILQVASGARVL